MAHHQHVWQKEPPDAIKRTSEDKYGDKRDMAHNSFWTSLEELQRLRLLVDEDPEYEKSSDWPTLVEWCSSCGSTRGVNLILPKEIKEPGVEVEEITTEKISSCDAFTQTPRQRRRRTGGKGSRLRRLLAFQLMLSNKHGLPHSRLSLRRLDARSPRERNNCVQGDCAGPMLLKEEKVEVVVKEEKIEMEESREKESCQSAGASAGGSTHFTPRSTHADVNLPSPQPLPCFLPFPNLYTPFFTPPNLPLYVSSPVGQMPGSFWVLCGACKSWGTIVT